MVSKSRCGTLEADAAEEPQIVIRAVEQQLAVGEEIEQRLQREAGQRVDEVILARGC